MQFPIKVIRNGKEFNMQIQASATKVNEIYIVTGGDRSITLQNNLPILEKKKLKNWNAKWEQTEGPELRSQVLMEIIKAINEYFDPPPRPRPKAPVHPWVNKKREPSGLPLGERGKGKKD